MDFARQTSTAVALLFLALFSSLALTGSASAKATVKVEPKTVGLDAEVELTITGLQSKRSYLIEVIAPTDTVVDCAASGAYENGQVTQNATAKADKKGKIKYSLTPQSALGENWCQATYSGTVTRVGQSKSSAKFSFKAKVGA